VSVLATADLTRRFGTTTALSGVTLDVGEGEVVGLVGPSGSGKSTLLRILTGFLAPTSGRASIRGVDVGGLDASGLRRLRADVGLIYQQFNLVKRSSALDNVLCGAVSRTGIVRSLLRRPPAEELRRAAEALDRVGLLERAHQRADTLSGGQQQRVAIARLLVQDPSVVLADEPVASLDPGSVDRVMRLLRSLADDDGRTVVVTLHQVELARRFCDRIIALEHGVVCIDSPAAAVTAAQLAALYQLSADPEDGPALDHQNQEMVAQ
jgi:phosphonate transport system ATP-binding protein